MWLLWWFACQCGAPSSDVAAPIPAKLVVPHDPEALKAFPACKVYADTVCATCGPATSACRGVRKVNDLCAQRDSCDEKTCIQGTERMTRATQAERAEMCEE